MKYPPHVILAAAVALIIGVAIGSAVANAILH